MVVTIVLCCAVAKEPNILSEGFGILQVGGEENLGKYRVLCLRGDRL